MDQRPNSKDRIYIIGSGSIGCLVAHTLRGLNEPPPITLLLHKAASIEEFEAGNGGIEVITDKVSVIRYGFDTELVRNPSYGFLENSKLKYDNTIRENTDVIYNLIVTVKANRTASAIGAIKRRLTSESTIMFLQNGMGVIDELNKLVFPDPEYRPSYVQGVLSLGVHSNKPFSVIHAGRGTISLGLLPRIPFDQIPTTENSSSSASSATDATIWGFQAQYLLQTITSCPVLAAVAVTPSELLQIQLEKLAVNCIINPLTALLDCQNDHILDTSSLSRTMYLLLSEICLVIQSLPELRGIPNIDIRFSPKRIEALVVSIARKTGPNFSSMLQDVRRGSRTEIEYLNGYIAQRGEELGIRAVLNFMIMQLVVGKRKLSMKKERDKILQSKNLLQHNFEDSMLSRSS